MMMVTIYGASDGRIEVEGDTPSNFTDEFSASRYGDLVSLSNGCEFAIRYEDDGFWRIYALRIPPGVEWTHRKGTNEDDDYSDVVTVQGHIEAVMKRPIGQHEFNSTHPQASTGSGPD